MATFWEITAHPGGMDSAVVNELACHRCDPGSNPGVGMRQGSGRPSKVGDFPRVLRFPPPRMTTERQIRAFENVSISSFSFLSNRRSINSV